jgi:hypothetical protein
VCPDLRLAGGAGLALLRFEGYCEGAPIRVDVAQDAAPRMTADALVVGGIRVESLQDQRANKLSAVLGRSALRDLVDLARAAWALSQVEIAPLSDMIVELDSDDLRQFRDDLVGKLLDAAGARV